MKRNVLLMLAGALAVGLIAAGCGGDDDDDSSDALTKQEFIAQGNAICKAGNAEIDAAAEETFAKNGQPTPAESDAFVTDTVVPNVQGQIDDMRALGIPEEDADQVNGILDEAEGIVDELEADPSSIEGDPFAPVNGDLKDYGLTTCAG
jgi:hypothetical protein